MSAVEKVLAEHFIMWRDLPTPGHRAPGDDARGLKFGFSDTAPVLADAEWMANNPSPAGIPHDPTPGENPYRASTEGAGS